MREPENPFPSLKVNGTLVGVLLFTAIVVAFLIACSPLTDTPTSFTGPRFGPDIDASSNTANISHSGNITKVVRFVEGLHYRDWQHDPVIRPTGDIHRTQKGELIDGSTHHRVRIYYSPDIVKWLKKCRNSAIKPSVSECNAEMDNKALPDGATMVKEMYKTVTPEYPEEDLVIGWAVMVKKNGASADGWFWVIHFKEAFRSKGVILNGHDLIRSEPLKSEFTQQWDQIQPHWEVITREDQVQIYEERYLNQYGDSYLLNTSFLGIGKVVKENRLFPRGYHYDHIKQQYDKALKALKTDQKPGVKELLEKWTSLMPVCLLGKVEDKALPDSLRKPLPDGASDPNDDINFTDGDGADSILYKIPFSQIKGAASAFVQLNYQNMPPYYLRDRFKLGKGGEQTQRLYYLLGHTRTEKTAIEGWKIRVAKDRRPIQIKAL
ncbi:hypothetical protein [Endozoicomonas lisbonensis]|uniref:Uncharacterized protein n=1 Tax=Endozoicomonas lisbonensis TaxID=3120522 RepID=A0ABV2SPF5_9GAMM